MRIRKRLTALLAANLFAVSASVFADEPLTLTIGTQDAAWPHIVEASHVLDGAPYKVKWAVLTGPAAQLSALYSKVLDVGLMGDTSLIIEQGNARAPWTQESAPLQIIAGWRNPDSSYPPIVTVVRKDADVKSLADLRGKTWGYNFGGFNYLQYVLSYNKADLKPKDFQGVKFGDGNVSASAFNAGQVAVYSGGYGPVKETVDKGDARVVIKSDELDIPALSVFTARTEVLRDPAKSRALEISRASEALVDMVGAERAGRREDLSGEDEAEPVARQVFGGERAIRFLSARQATGRARTAHRGYALPFGRHQEQDQGRCRVQSGIRCAGGGGALRFTYRRHSGCPCTSG